MSGRAALLSPRVLAHLLVLRPLLKLLFGVNTEGEENLEGLDQYILAANHNSHLDILLLFSILPVSHIGRTHAVAAEDHFSRYPILFRLVTYLFQPVWIRRDVRSADPLEGMKSRLRQGHNLVIFPEGTRGKPGELQKFKTGVGRLAEAFRDVPTLPVFLSGPERALPRQGGFPVPLWNQVTIGPPQTFDSSSAEFTRSLETLIRELSESRAAGRHRREKRTRRAFTVAVLGIDGSGKSTVARRLGQELSAAARVCVVSDRLEMYQGGDRQGLQPLSAERLRQVLGRRAKTAKSLARYKIPKLAELLLRDHLLGEVQRWYAPDIVVLDGSPLINLTAWAGIYKGPAFDAEVCSGAMKILTGAEPEGGRRDPLFRTLPELRALYRLGLAGLRVPDAVILLDVDPAVSLARISSRGEKRQVHETAAKLGRLRDGYRMVCDVVRRDLGVPVAIQDGSLALEQVMATALDHAEGARREFQDG